MHDMHRDFIARRDKLLEGGGPEKNEKVHAKGKLTARERIALLFDEGSFVEYGLFVKCRGTDFGMDKVYAPYDGVITGFGTINGRTVYVVAHDSTVQAGSQGEMHTMKIYRLLQEAIMNGKPVISLMDSSGGRIQEGVDVKWIHDVVRMIVQGSGYIPQLAGVMGPCAGGGAYAPALMDFVVCVDKTSSMFVTGPSVIRQVTGEIINEEGLGGAHVHTEKSGVGHRLALDDPDCIAQLKTMLSYLPDNCREKPPVTACTDDIYRLVPELDDIVPDDRKKAFDVKRVIELIADNGDFFEIQPDYAPNMVVAFARMNGRPVGFVANQSLHLAGAIDMNAADKAAHFVNFCDSFNVPLVFLADCPGCLSSVALEHSGMLRHGAKLLYAVSNASVPKITLTMRRLYGGSAIAMCDKGVGADVTISWPTGENAVMGAEAASRVIFRKQIAAAEDPEAKMKELVAVYEDVYYNPYKKAARGFTDMIIEPNETRRVLIQCLSVLENKQIDSVNKKHGNMPC